MKGTIKFFHAVKGYGFIKADDEDKEYFFHISALQDHDAEIKEGQEVEFHTASDPRGEKAVKVKILN